MADYGMIIMGGVLLFMLGTGFGVFITYKGIRFGIVLTPDIQTNFPFENNEIKHEIEKE